MNNDVYKALFGDKTPEEIFEQSAKDLKEIRHPNTLNYFEIERDGKFSSYKHVYIPASEGEGKPSYAKYIKYVREKLLQERGCYTVKKDKVKSYDDWFESKKLTNKVKKFFKGMK